MAAYTESMRSVAVLGATGSIGTQALEIVAGHPELEACALAAHSDHAGLVAAAERARGGPDRPRRPRGRRRRHGACSPARCSRAPTAIERLVAGCGADIVLNAIVGAAGLRATMATFAAGADLALANKESLVAGGELVMEALRRSGRRMLPVDSEHSALAQCLAGAAEGAVTGLVVTASGGPFRGRSRESLAAVTVADALAHPTWTMGAKITIDSATLMNKGLEVIEAHHLFGVPYDDIEVVVHPQSIVHGMVRFRDGALIAHVGHPDMRVPISWALTFPQRVGDAGADARPHPGAAARLRAARPRHVPLPRARPPGGHRGRHGAVRPERRQRGRGEVVPGSARSASSTSPTWSSGRSRLSPPSRSSRWTRCSRPTRRARAAVGDAVRTAA